MSRSGRLAGSRRLGRPAPVRNRPKLAAKLLRNGGGKRFHGAKELDPMLLSSEAAKVAENVLQFLSSLPNASLCVTLEIEADLPDGVPEHNLRTILENARTPRVFQFRVRGRGLGRSRPIRCAGQCGSQTSPGVGRRGVALAFRELRPAPVL